MRKSNLRRILTPLLTLLLLCCFCVSLQAEDTETRTVTWKKKTIRITSPYKGNWKVSTDVEWLKAEKDSNEIKITVSKNTGKKRTGKVTVKKGKKKTVYTITQKKYDVIKDCYKYDWKACNKKDVTDAFLKKVAKIAKKLNLSPDDLMTVMAFESSLDHKAVNSKSNATGLIQFLPSTAAKYGTTVAKLKKMSAVKQLDYVYYYLRDAGTLSNLGDLYMAILWPKAVGKEDSYVLWKKGTSYYKRNKGLDVNKDKKITRGECLQKVLDCRKQYVGE